MLDNIHPLALPITLGLLASLNVFLGGYLVLKFKKYFNIILGFAGGVMLTVVVFQIFPEIIHLHEELELPIYWASFSIIFGILFFHMLSYFFPLHEHGHHVEHEHHNHNNHLKKGLGVYGAIFMTLHSFIDGFGIGAGFLLSPIIGLAIALAVIMHNFSDGINTTSTLLHSNVSKNKFKLFFGLNILAPILGVLTSFYLEINELIIFVYLGIFSGSILYLAISDILPQAHAEKNKFLPILATLAGIVFVITLTIFLGTHSH